MVRNSVIHDRLSFALPVTTRVPSLWWVVLLLVTLLASVALLDGRQAAASGAISVFPNLMPMEFSVSDPSRTTDFGV